jgi:hypothetical protein
VELSAFEQTVQAVAQACNSISRVKLWIGPNGEQEVAKILHILKGCSSLRALDIHECCACGLEDMEAIATLTCLLSLRLKLSGQQGVSSLSTLCSLTELHLCWQATALSAALGNVLRSLPFLTTLSLDLPDEDVVDEGDEAISWDVLVELPQLVKLSLSCSSWSEDPAFIGSLTRLTFLQLEGGGCDDEELELPVGELLQLQELNIRAYVILPASISSLTKLTVLHVEGLNA